MAHFLQSKLMNRSNMSCALCVLVSLLLGLTPAAAQSPLPESDQPRDVRLEVQVGIDTGELRGGDHRALQAAVDYVAGLGGGTVRIAPGRYQMRNALVLRSNVEIVGEPGTTVLV